MGYFQVRYDSGAVIYDHRAFIRLSTGAIVKNISECEAKSNVSSLKKNYDWLLANNMMNFNQSE